MNSPPFASKSEVSSFACLLWGRRASLLSSLLTPIIAIMRLASIDDYMQYMGMNIPTRGLHASMDLSTKGELAACADAYDSCAKVVQYVYNQRNLE